MTRRAEHDELEPKRLLDEHATPDALRDALQALREQAPSPAASARIRERLASSPAPAPAPRVGHSLIAIALLSLIGALTWRTWPTNEPVRAPHAAAPPDAPLTPLPATHEVAPKAEMPRSGSARARAAAAQLEQAAEPAQQPVAEPARLPALAPEIVRVPKRAKEPLAHKPSSTPLVASTVLEPEPALEVPAKRLPPSPVPVSQGDEAERMFADPQDEAGLLYRARRLSSSDPNAALRLLVLHEASFPDGAFVQERDMLEIQIHERLGHAATAKRLAALFKQRYPESVYRVSP